jgi:hypothetical protein
MKRVVGIDVGWANLGSCALDLGRGWEDPIMWKNERILEGKMTEDLLREATFQWCKSNEETLQSATAIVLERQHQPPLRIMTAIIWTLYREKTRFVAPQTVGKRYGLRRIRKEKKQDAVALVKKNMRTRMPRQRKVDDLADAFLLAFFGFEDFGGNTEGWIE